MKNQKAVVLVTDHAFWVTGVGANLKMAQLARFLAGEYRLVMVVCGVALPSAEAMRATIGCEVECVHVQDFAEKTLISLRATIAELAPFAAVIEYVHLWMLKSLFGRETAVLLDTNDLMHLRRAAFEKFGRSWGSLDARSEWAILSGFDGVIFIQEEEYELGLKHLAAGKCLLSPPALDANPVPWNAAPVVGFIGSPAPPNIDGLEWLHDTVYGGKSPVGHEVHIYGTIGRSHTVRHKCRNFQFKGEVGDVAEMFAKVRLTVNPMRFGSGIKIKSLESLACGIPHVTTSVGVQGFPDHGQGCCLIADEPEPFMASIEELLRSDEACARLRESGLDMIRRHFSLESCLAPVARVLEGAASGHLV